MKITVIAVGKLKKSPESALIDEYLKRLRGWSVKVKEVNDGTKLLSNIPKNSLKLVLDEHGKSLTSAKFSDLLQEWKEQNQEISFLIGGPDGHDAAIKKEADIMLSLGSMTWPHMLTRVLLFEQLYRAWSIHNNHPYHRQ